MQTTYRFVTAAAVCALAVLVVIARPACAQDEPRTLAIGQGDLSRPLPPAAKASETRQDAHAGQGTWWIVGGVALVLALFGGMSLASRRFLPRQGPAPLEVIGRTSLSPKHAVYLVRAGGRVLVVGTGAQGPPALLGEWPSQAAAAALDLARADEAGTVPVRINLPIGDEA